MPSPARDTSRPAARARPLRRRRLQRIPTSIRQGDEDEGEERAGRSSIAAVDMRPGPKFHGTLRVPGVAIPACTTGAFASRIDREPQGCVSRTMTRSHALTSFAVLLLASRASADATAYACDPPSSPAIAPVVVDNACRGYEIRDAAGTVTRTVKFPFIGSGKMIASADGRTVPWCSPHLPGSHGFAGQHRRGFRRDVTPDPIAASLPRGVRIAMHKHLARHEAQSCLAIDLARRLDPRGAGRARANSFTITTPSTVTSRRHQDRRDHGSNAMRRHGRDATTSLRASWM